ncbi:hypothetical protein DH2020_023877 [Rehmannia glutinosa]|uniref:Pentatricopeptide repeat-containing protein n=1 Tax=Rehmannia glutinosa TaxID=99300 RepID=A0ABR0W912_REHGL
MPLRKLLRRALHTRNLQPKSVNSPYLPPPPPPPLFSSPPDTFLVDKAISILKLYHPSQLDPLILQFTPQATSYLLLQCQNNKTLILKFLNWARKLPFFSNQLQCHCLSIHILTRFKLYKTAQSLAEEVAVVFPDDEKGDLVFSCLKDTYQACNSSSAVFDLLVKAFSNLKLIDRALNVMKLARYHGFMPSVLSYNSILEAIIRRSAHGYVELARDLYHDMIDNDVSPNVFTYNILIRGLYAYCKMGNINEAYALLKLMWEKNLEPNVITYNVIINGLCREGRMKETNKVFEEMKGNGLVPDEITYNTLVNGYCKEGNFHQALVLHAEMVRNGLSPNVVTYTSLINSMCKARNIHRAVEFFDQMQIRGLSPNEKTYTTLIDGFSQQGFMDEAYRLLSEMISRGLSPSIITYNALINGHCVSDKAFRMKKEMIEKGIFPDAITYSSLIQGLCGQRKLIEACELFKEMWRLGLQPDKCTYTSLINAYCAEDDIESAIRLHNEMINKGFFPDVVTYSVLINGLNKQTRSKEAKRLLFKLYYEQLVPHDVTYDLLIESCSNNEFRSVLALIKGFCMKGLMNEADRVFQAMLQTNHKPSEAVYNVLIHGHCRTGNLQKAIKFYREMVHHGLVPHAVTVIALAKELHKMGLTEDLSQILQDTLRSCKIIDGDLAKDLVEVNYKEGNMDAVFNILNEMAKDGLLPNEARL